MSIQECRGSAVTERTLKKSTVREKREEDLDQPQPRTRFREILKVC